MLSTERHTRLGPSPPSGHAWLETRLKCPFMAKGKNAQAEPEPETPRQRRGGTGRGHHPAAPPALPGDTCSSSLTLSCRIPSCWRSGILKLSLKVSVRGADRGPRTETTIAKRDPQPWLSYSKLSQALAQGTTYHKLASGLQGGLLPGWDPDTSGWRRRCVSWEAEQAAEMRAVM